MKIYASHRDDVLKRKAEYDERAKQLRTKRTEQESAFREEYAKVRDIVKDKVIAELSGIDLELSIEVSLGITDSIDVVVRDESHLHDDNKSLSWQYHVSLMPDGQVRKESSSWSGLNATTPENLHDLEMVLEALKALNSIDWENVLDQKFPKYSDYVDRAPDDFDPNHDFDIELKLAAIEDALEAGHDAIKGYGYKEYSPNAQVYYLIQGQTAKRFIVNEILATQLENTNQQYRLADHPYTISKTTLLSKISYPLETLDLNV